MNMPDSSNSIVNVLSGSFLYGTNVDTSDVDTKVIFFPKLVDLVQLKPVKNMRGGQAGVDLEYIPVQVFLRDYVVGQSYAIEMAHAMLQEKNKEVFKFCTVVEANRDIFESMIELLEELEISPNLSSMVAYAISQANRYSLTVKRLATANRAIKIVDAILEQDILSESTKIRALISELTRLPFVKEVEDPHGYVMIEINEKCFPLNVKDPILAMKKGLEKMVLTYGKRVSSVPEGETDWKSLMHAIRISGNACDLLAGKRLSFPDPRRKSLLMVRNGEISYDWCCQAMEDNLRMIDELKRPDAPEKDQSEKINQWIEKVVYKL